MGWTGPKASLIAGALDIPGQAIIDGEVVVIHQGRTNFSELQAELAAGRQDRLVHYAFDLRWRHETSATILKSSASTCCRTI
jgi:bifunctional non-homologous end joining protein LigD